MIDFDEVFDALSELPEYQVISGSVPLLSYPLLREVDGKVYLVYLAYNGAKSGWPRSIFIYDPEYKVAQSFDPDDALFRLQMRMFPAEPRFSGEERYEEDLEDFFWDTIESGTIDKSAYEDYLKTCVYFEPDVLNGYYWAFAE